MLQNKKRLPLWPAIMVLIILIILYILNPVCRYLYTKDFITRSDKQLAEMLANEIESADITNLDKPIFFFGSAPTRTNGSCLDLSSGKYDLYSVFSVRDTLALDTVEASRYIVAYLNDIGYHYTAPTEEDMTNFQEEIDANIPLAKTFPWYDSVLETEHCIFVQLSDSFYDLHFKSE